MLERYKTFSLSNPVQNWNATIESVITVNKHLNRLALFTASVASFFCLVIALLLCLCLRYLVLER